MVKLIKRTLAGIFLILILIISAGIIFTTVYKDEIIGYFIKETNKHITTPITVGEMEVSIFSNFPNISINLQDVTIKESIKGHKGILGKAKRISVSFNPIDLIKKNYIIHSLHLKDAEIKLRIDKKGNPNYLFYNNSSASEGQKLILQNITCENLKIDYLDIKSSYHFALFVKNAKSQLQQLGTKLKVSVDGNLVTDEIKIKNRIFFNNKLVDIKTTFEVDLKNKIYVFKSGNINVDNGEFEISGNINASQKFVNLEITGVNTTFQTINSLLSSDISKYFHKYNSRGSVYFSGTVIGKYSNNSRPKVTLDFGAKNASFFHPQYNRQIKDVNLTGQFTTGKINNQANYRLDINKFSCKLEDKLLEGNMKLRNFDEYNIDLRLKGEADVNTLLLLFPREYVKTAFGYLKMDIHILGKLKNPNLKESLHADGEVELKNISFVLNGEKLPFNKINGSFILKNNDLAISELIGYVGNSDFRLNGFIKDLSTILLLENRVYKMQADLRSKYLDFDELLRSNFASRDTTSKKNGAYEFNISPRLSLDFYCDVDHLKFKRFNGRGIKGQIEIKNQIAILTDVSFSSMGGRVNVSGSINNKKDNLVETVSEANLYNISIDSIFYVFRNFNQNWLVDQHLKGKLDADINLYMNFNKNLILNSRSLVADIGTSISHGELNNFEPMMKLSKFVEEESLAHMRFSHITNNIKIENRTIYLPEMEIQSNVSNILLYGTYTFDKDIDYHLRVPLKSFIRISKRKGYNQSARKGMNLLLKIHGNTSDYTISYDSKALKDNIKSDFLDEGQEWKNLVKKDSTFEKDVPGLENEYFDFDSSENDLIK